MEEVLRSPNPKHQRFAEAAKFLPVAFVSTLILLLFLIYNLLHCLPRLEQERDQYGHAVFEFVLFNSVSVLLITCYLRSILVHPGRIPSQEEDPSWDLVAQDLRGGGGQSEVSLSYASFASQTLLSQQESKRSGDRRQCKWCAKYKPDRCHHCRVCRMCILKMDHHCPWIYNCVGFKNHKYFFLLLLYSTIDTNIIIWTMYDSVRLALNPTTPFLTMFLLLFGESLAGFLGILVSLFFGFHIYLMLRSMTTIEYCEKATKPQGYDAHVYDRGVLGNIQAVLGDNVMLWLLPVSTPPGSGLSFVSEDTRLVQDTEWGRGARGRKAGRRGEESRRQRRSESSAEGNVSGHSNEDASSPSELGAALFDGPEQREGATGDATGDLERQQHLDQHHQ